MIVWWTSLLGAMLCLALARPTQATVTVDKGAYKNVVVSFSSSLSPDKSTHILQSAKQILKETSSVLQKAVGIQIGSVMFHVPVTWDPTTLEGGTSVSSATLEVQPDIRIDSMTDSAFGKYPVALQHGGCGVPGLEIGVPEDFLTREDTYPKGQLLAREWLKYRYGVFDEQGFHNDSMYPSHYTIPGSDDIRVTDCTFPQLHYDFRDSNGSDCSLLEDDCVPHPNTTDDITSSLMYFHPQLTAMEEVCGTEGHPHNEYSPTKQNLLCSYKSVWEIIQLSGEVQEKRSSQSVGEIDFSYIQDSRLRAVVTFQNTNSLENQKYLILNSIRKLWHDVPLQSKLALYAFKEEVEENRALSELSTDEDRSVNIISSFQKPVADPCVSCAINKAIDVLSSDSSNAPGSIVVMTGSDATENKKLIEKLTNSRLCLLVIGFHGVTQRGWRAFLDAASPCSSYWQITDDQSDEQNFEILSQALHSMLPAPPDNTKTKTVITGLLSTESPLTLPADVTASSYTLWVFKTVDLDNIYCRKGDQLLEMKLKVRTENLLAVTFDAPAEEVKCGLNYASKPHLAQVQMTTKPGAYFENSLLLLDTTPIGNPKQMPVIIYAKVNFGLYPVLNCDVRAVVTSPEGVETEIQLWDDGRGDPDITRNDGIYSRYFTQIDNEGDYKVVVVATDNNGQAKVGKNGQTPCCGSTVQLEEEDVPPLQWTHESTFRAISKKPEEGYKPSRILDLKVDRLDLPNSLTLKWTAPGGEMSNGKASSYEFSMYCQHENCNEYGVLPKWIGNSGNLKPKEYGREQKVTFQLTPSHPTNVTVRFSIKALNKKQQHSIQSNFAFVNIFCEDLPALTTPSNPESQNPADSANIGLIIAYVIIALASLVLIGGLVYYLVVKPKRRRFPRDQTSSVIVSSKENGQVNNGFIFKSPELLNGSSDINRSSSFPVLLYTHQQIKDYKDKSKDPPLYEANQLAKPWASTHVLFSNEDSSTDIVENNSESIEIEQSDTGSNNLENNTERNSKF